MKSFMHHLFFLRRFRPGPVWFLIVGLVGLFALPVRAATNWIDISTPLVTRLTNSGAKAAWPGGCSGVVVNRTNGHVTIKVVGLGLWRSSDQGTNWQRIDDNTISGRDETGWATSVDQNEPGRMASFSLDGTAGWTTDGRRWQRFASLGRNWDFGSVDWASPIPKVVLGAKHETSPPGEVYLTQDGGGTWKLLPIHLAGESDRLSMLGVMDATTFIYSKDNGIHRSRDAGQSWEEVSPVNPQTRIPVLFRGANYLGTTNGLLVSKDLGATWKAQGAAVNVWQGPFFGRDAQEMVVVGKDGVFRTSDAGATWTKVAALKTGSRGFSFNPNWFGCYAWDPVNNLLYVSVMGNPVYRLQL